jgi:predicted nucleic acid-binding protein
MSGTKYLLDTNIVLYILSGNQALADHLYQKNLYASVITEIELLGYKSLTAKEEKIIRSFLSAFRIIGIDETIKEVAIALRRNYGLKLPDCIIAATAISLQLTLVTSDKQFKLINNLLLELYES